MENEDGRLSRYLVLQRKACKVHRSLRSDVSTKEEIATASPAGDGLAMTLSTILHWLAEAPGEG
jgi:hypothetical protein